MRNSFHARNIYCYAIVFAAATLISQPALRAQGARIKLAVVGLDNPATLPKSNIGNALVDILDSDISAAGKYTLLERAELEQLKQELNLGGSRLANVKSFAQKGGLVGADFLLLGKVSDYTYNEHQYAHSQFVAGVGWQQVMAYQHVADVRVDIRLVDVKTGEDVRSVSGHGTAQNTGSANFQNIWFAYIASQGQGTLSSLATLLTEASNNAMQDAVRQLNDMYDDLAALRVKGAVSAEVSSIGRGKILAEVGQGQFVIGVPSTANLKVGDRFNVIAEVPIKNSQGVVVYSERRPVGALQITDISEATKAMARLVNTSGSNAATAHPSEGDTLVFDEQYGKSLRGMAGASSGGAATGQIARGGASSGIQTYIQRGDRFMDNREFSEALEQYKEGLGLEPNNATLLAKKAISEMEINDLTDAEDDAEKAITAGGSIGLHIYHVHTFGHCEGVLVFERGKVYYEPTTGNDEFTAASKGNIAVRASIFPGSNIPDLIIEAPGQNGKQRKYNVVVPMFLTPLRKPVGLEFQANGDAADKTRQLDGMIVRLVNASLQ